MAATLHKEKQRFNDKIVLGLLGLGVVAALFGAFNALFVTGEPMLNAFVYLALAVVLGGFMYWLVSLRLQVTVSDKSIKYKLSTPLNEVSQKIKWKEVADCRIVKSPQIAEWHGANLSYGSESHVSLAGRNGLEITTKDGQQYFIGCRKVDDLLAALD